MLGASVAFSPLSLLFILFGVLWGIVGGALPGITGSIAMALLLPLTFTMKPSVALMMLAGVYIGAMYGSSITAILIRTPGAPASAATIIDGYELHKQGKSGVALGISLITGTVGGLFSVFILVALAVPLANVALAFGPSEYFGITIFGLAIISSLAGRSMVKGLISGILGLILATVGMDPFSGVTRFTYGSEELLGGIDLIAAMIGLFAVSEVFVQASEIGSWEKIKDKFSSRLPSWAELKSTTRSTTLGTIIGTIVGIMPGAGGAVAGFISYNEAKRWSKHPEKFGKGSLEGVAAPEAANNAVTGGAMVPLLAFGIPGSNAAAIMLGALMLQGLRPGPMLFQNNPDIVYSLFVGMMIGNVFMLLTGYLLIKPCIYVVNISKPVLMASILVLVTIGTYAINNNINDVWIALITGVVGYFMRKYDFSPSAMVLALILGFLVETSLRRSLVLSYGSISCFYTRPIALVMIILAILTLIFPIIRAIREARKGI
ncbi:MAG: tripartite tricarboxylate transporter permease [Thermodesulfobacteriota bacterium]|nr:tripartite tricarboxylate transporter permease [Thermodesulfobacteriota bacterium]